MFFYFLFGVWFGSLCVCVCFWGGGLSSKKEEAISLEECFCTNDTFTPKVCSPI